MEPFTYVRVEGPAAAVQQVDRHSTEGGTPGVAADEADTPARDDSPPKPEPSGQTAPQTAEER